MPPVIRRDHLVMRSVLIGLFLAAGLLGSTDPGYPGQLPASSASHATPNNRSNPAPTAQDDPYDPRAVFAPLTLSETANRYRSAYGAPALAASQKCPQIIICAPS